MPKVDLELGNDLAALLRQTNLPLKKAALEMIVLELYRRGTISSGKAGEVLGMSRWEFVRHSSRLGIPYFDMTDEEWEAELAEVEAICRNR